MAVKVERKKKEVYDTCEKHTFLITEDGKELFQRRVSYSNWQLEDGEYDRRVKDFVVNNISETSRNDIELAFTE